MSERSQEQHLTQESGIGRNATETYLQILGMEKMPEVPAQAPFELSILRQLLGDLPELIQLTGKDGRERKQYTSVKNGKPTFHTILGDKPTTSGRNNEFVGGSVGSLTGMRKLGVMFGERPLLEIHTHPDDDIAQEAYQAGEMDTFSIDDLAYYAANPRMGYMFGIANTRQVHMLVQTKQADNLSLRAGTKFNEVWQRLINARYNAYSDIQTFRMYCLPHIEALGFAMYTFPPREARIVTPSSQERIVLSRLTTLDRTQ